MVETTFDDILAVLIRAIRVIDTTIDFPTAKTYADYMVRIASWEVDYAKRVTANTLEKTFPILQAQISEKITFYSPYIYIGNDSKMKSLSLFQGYLRIQFLTFGFVFAQC